MRLLDLAPDADTYVMLGSSYLAQARIDEALTSYRQALTLDPQHPPSPHNYRPALNYHPSPQPERISQEHRSRGQKIPGPLAPPASQRKLNSRLRIGYI